MKFGKVLKVSSENMPADMHDLFLRYKELKKQIKAIPINKEAAAAGNENQASVSIDGSATGSASTGTTVAATVLSLEEQAFITTLNEDLARFNRYFMEKEEEAVIRLQAICDELAAAAAALGVQLPAALTDGSSQDAEDAPTAAAAAAVAGPSARAQQHPQHQHQLQLPQQEEDEEEDMEGARPATAGGGGLEAQAGRSLEEKEEGAGRQVGPIAEPQQQQSHGHQHHRHAHHQHHGFSLAEHQLQEIKSRLVHFHGEMVLLLHWSLLNYAAVVKILKKHDKRTGVLLRAPYIANVLQQPFSSTAIMSRLAKRAEQLVAATTQLSPAPHAVLAATNPAAGAAAAPGGAWTAAGPHADPEGAAAAEGSESAAATAATGAAVTAEGPAVVGSGGAVRSGGAAAAGAASASEASSLTFVVDKEGQFAAGAPKHAEPLVGRTMHALETWANLRKNAITPSTVIAAEADQQPHQPIKRKAEASVPDAAAAATLDPASKVAKLGEEPQAQ